MLDSDNVQTMDIYITAHHDNKLSKTSDELQSDTYKMSPITLQEKMAFQVQVIHFHAKS